MTRPTREEVARIIDPSAWALDADGYSVEQISAGAALTKADAVLSLFPEGRAEQDRGGEVERLRADVFRPGVMRCAKCQFRLIRNVLYAQTGNIGVGTSETEPCPNGCGPLWPVTWKDECKEADKCWDQQVERAVKAEADLSTARLRIKALETENDALLAVEGAARSLPRRTPAPGGAGTEHPFMIAAAHVWDNDRALGNLDKVRALLSSAQGETKEGFDELPELPCGEQPGATAPATAALAVDDEMDEPCEYCGEGDPVPATGYWRCPVCDAEWNQDDEVEAAAPDAAALAEGE